MLLPHRHFRYQLHENVFRVKIHPTPRRGKGKKIREGGKGKGYGPISYEKCAKSHVGQCGGQKMFSACGVLSSIPQQLCAMPLLLLLLHHWLLHYLVRGGIKIWCKLHFTIPKEGYRQLTCAHSSVRISVWHQNHYLWWWLWKALYIHYQRMRPSSLQLCWWLNKLIGISVPLR